MKKIFLLFFLLIPNITFGNIYIEKKVSGHLMKVVQYPIGTNEYKIKVMKVDDATNLGNILAQNNALSGVNGVFFCPVDYDWCNTQKSFTDSERYIEGEKFATYQETGYRGVFGWTQDEIPFIYRSGILNQDDEDLIYYGLGNLPVLLFEGKNTLKEYWENDQILSNMKLPGLRNFVCSDKEKKNIYFGMVYNATIDQLADVLSEFGCYDALNLDAGASTTFMYNNSYIIGPQKRDILDGIGIERIGLDMSEIKNISQNITSQVIQDIENKTKKQISSFKKEKKLTYLNKRISELKKIKQDFYSRISQDIYEKNIVGEYDRVGYTFEVKKLSHLKLITLINQIIFELESEKNILSL